MSLVILLVGTAIGQPTEHDGRYLKEYDPTNQWVEGGRLCCHLVSTDDLAEALRYESLAELRDHYTQAVGLRSDGLPDRPLTAFTIEIVNAEKGPARDR